MIHKLLKLTVVSAILCALLYTGYKVAFPKAEFLVKSFLGYTEDSIKVSGTGSMYPTFPKGEGTDPKELSKQIVSTQGMLPYPNGFVFRGKRYFGVEVGRGDIVVIENEKIRQMSAQIHGTQTGWVKRVVALPGDTLELRSGIVYLNDTPLPEPYTAAPQSTFGESYLKECTKVTVPDSSIFVMGDNRKGSGDSREIGFIEMSAINHILPLNSQKGTLDKFWRDTSKDFDPASRIKLDKTSYLTLLNAERVKSGAKALKYQPKLEASAQKRGQAILKYDDFSFEATISGYTMKKAMNDVGYSNIVWGEAPTQGYFEASELFDNQFQFPNSKKFLTDKNFQEVGISEVQGQINGCPTQVIVQHFAGYVPPNYKAEDIKSWKDALSRLKEIQPGWLELKNAGKFYEDNKSDIDRLNNIIETRIQNIQIIVSRMESNSWLTQSEETSLRSDVELAKEQDTIAKKLNDQ